MSYLNQRLQALRDLLKEHKLDGLLISTPENRRYLSGFADLEGAGYILVTTNQAFLATEFHATEASRATSGFHVVRIQRNLNWVPSLIAESGGDRLGIEADHLTVSSRDQLMQALKEEPNLNGRKVEVVSSSGLIEDLRVFKDPEELDTMQEAIDITDGAFEEVSPQIEPGWTERELAWRLEAAMRDRGGDGLAFPTLIGSGPNGGFAGNIPTERVIQDGDPIIIDMGATYHGYCSDLTRTVAIGEPDERFKRLYNAVYDSQKNAIEKVRHGIKGGEIYAMLTKVLSEAGFGEHAGPAFGHSIGLEVHEGPRIRYQHPGVFEKGMAFTIEPGIYIPDFGGARLEDVVYLEDTGARVMSKAKKLSKFGV